VQNYRAKRKEKQIMADEMEGMNGGEEGSVENQKVQLDAKLEGLFQQTEAAPELAGPPRFWDVFAVGPYQVPALQPSRILEVGEQATILTVVYLNPSVPSPYPGQNACDIITGFGAKIEFNYFTSNMQTLQPVPTLHRYHCLETTPGQCWYRDYWTFTPQDPACLYCTNICVRICNCDDYYVRQYSGFARWVANLDFDFIFGAPVWQFDHPIRYMVSDYRQRCECNEPGNNR
jgi:hypothetical protein